MDNDRGVMEKRRRFLLGLAWTCCFLGVASVVSMVIMMWMGVTGGVAGGMLAFIFAPVVNTGRFIMGAILVIIVVVIGVKSFSWNLHIQTVCVLGVIGMVLWTSPFIYSAVRKFTSLNTPFTPTAGTMSFSLKDCRTEERNLYISDEYLVLDIICGVHFYKQKNGEMPKSIETVRNFIMNEAVFGEGYEIVFDGESPRNVGIISIVYGKGCGSWRDGDKSGYISGWFVDRDEGGLACVEGR